MAVMNDSDLVNQLGKACRGRTFHSDLGIRDLLFAFGSPLDALVYSRLLWPEFVEIEGMVFAEGTIASEADRERLELALKEYGNDAGATERAFNFVEVPADLFGKRADETTREQDHWLAERLAEMWRSRLHLLYPTRQFVVEVVEPQEPGGNVGVIFYQGA
jgi:hypothetical protein